MRSLRVSLLTLSFVPSAIILAACSSSTVNYGGDEDGGQSTTADAGKDATPADDATTGDATESDATESDAGTDARDATTGDARLDADGSTPADAAMSDAAWTLDGGDGGAIPDLWVVRAGTIGSGTVLSGTSVAVYIDQFSPAGVLQASLPLPTAVAGGNKQISLTGASVSEGYLNRSTDTHYVTLAGYAADVGTAAVAGTTAAFVSRVVARINAAGTIDTSTTLSTAFTGGSVRSAVTTDGSVFWVGGNSGTTASSGIEYVVLGGTGLTQIAAANGRVASIYGGQLYASSGTAPFDGVSTVGTGLPTSAATMTHLAGFPSTGTPSPYAFVALDLSAGVPGLDTIYLADDDAATQGIQRWQFIATSWTKTATFADGVTAIAGHGLTGMVTGGTVALFATLGDGRLVKIVDTGLATATVTTLSTASANTAYRGVAFAPQ